MASNDLNNAYQNSSLANGPMGDVPTPESLQEPRLDPMPGVDVPLEQMPEEDPLDLMAAEYNATYDPEEDIYGVRNVQQLLGEDEMLYGGIQQEETPSAAEQLGLEEDHPLRAISDVAEGWNNESNPVSPKGATETAKAIIGGAIEGAAIAPANLLNWGFSESALQIGTRLTGKTREELIQESPQLYKQYQAELPEFLKTETLHGNLLNTASQFGAGYGAVSMLSKIGKARAVLGGAPGWLNKLGQYGEAAAERYPSLTQGLAKIKAAAQVQGKLAATDFVAFDGAEGNLANLMVSMSDSNPILSNALTQYLAVDADDNELEARFKNTLAGQLGETLGVSMYLGGKVLKSLQRLRKGIKTDTRLAKGDIENALRDSESLEKSIAEFNAATQRINETPQDQLLDELFQGGGKEVEVIDDLADAREVVEKVHKVQRESLTEERLATREKALDEMIREVSEQRTKAFDADGFGADLERSLKAGEPVDVEDLLDRHMGEATLTDIDAFKDNFKAIVSDTTKLLKRFESNKSLEARVKDIFAVDLGHEARLNGALLNSFDSLVQRGKKSLNQDEEALMEMIALKYQQRLLNTQMARLALARNEAKMLGRDVEALTEHGNTLSTQLQTAKQLEDMLASNAGRRLQARQINPTDESTADFYKTYEMAKKNRPLLEQGTYTLSGDEWDALGQASADLHGLGHLGDPGGAGRLGKLFGHYTRAALRVAQSGARFTAAAATEVFYNNVLASFKTMKSIGWSNGLMKGTNLASSGIGAALAHDKERFFQVADEATAFIRYIGEGFGAGMAVLRTGQKHVLDYTPTNPRVIHSDGIKEHFGKTLGEALRGTLFERGGTFADWMLDHTGNVVRFPTTHMLGSVDTVFRVANQRAIIWRDLMAAGRSRGFEGQDLVEYAAQRVDDIAEDLILARATDFKLDRNSLKQKEFGVRGLKALHEALVDSTDDITLAHPLRSSRHSDRWVFRFFSKVDDAARMLGIVGTWEMPFVKVFANSVQYGVDMMPGTGLLSTHNQRVIQGEMGAFAQQQLLGKQMLGGALMLAGIGAANSGLLAPISGNITSEKTLRSLTDEGHYTIQIPYGEKQAITLNLEKGSPIVDGALLPGQLWQLSQSAIAGKMDPGAFTYASLALAGESFSSQRFLRGMSVSLDSFLNPSYSTAENFKRNVIAGGAVSITPILGSRLWQDVKAFTDPSYRDWGNYTEYAMSRMPWLSEFTAPTFDHFGNPRPSNDYIGSTEMLATNAVRFFTPVGMKVVSRDALVEKLEEFALQGKTLIPPQKNMSYQGIVMPLDQYKNDKGESLWEAYNRELRESKFWVDGKQVTLRENLNGLIESPEIQEGQPNVVSSGTGKRQVYEGSQFLRLAAEYQMAKEEIRERVFNDFKYLDGYRNEAGESFGEVWEREKELKERVQD